MATSKRSKAEIGRIGRAWLKEHHTGEMIVVRPIAIYFAEQATRIKYTIQRAKITSPEEFAIYFDAEKETRNLTKFLVGPDGLLLSTARIEAARVWRDRPRTAKAFKFRLPKFIRRAIDSFFREVRAEPWWQNIAGNTQDMVGRTIKRELDRGASIPNMAKAVQTTLVNAIPQRATAIARTETTGAMNAGQHLALNAIAEENDLMELLSEWLAIDDKRLRPDHRKANGQQIDPSDDEARFKVGGELARFPGDPKLSAKQRVNCRCTTVAVFPDLDRFN